MVITGNGFNRSSQSSRRRRCDAMDKRIFSSFLCGFILASIFFSLINLINFEAPSERRLPSAVIMGVRKCGTRALLQFLSLHKDIEIAKEEVHFFNRKWNKGLDWYRSQMPVVKHHQISIEKTPGYFISFQAPSRIFAVNSAAKLLLIVREPVSRAISDYTQIFNNRLARNKSKLADFDNLAIKNGRVMGNYKPVSTSIYHLHIRKWLDIFNPNSIHIIDGDNLIRNPLEELQKVEKFLQLDPFINKDMIYYNSTRKFYCMKKDSKNICLGSTKGRSHRPVSNQTIETLKKFYYPHNKEFFKIVNRTFTWN